MQPFYEKKDEEFRCLFSADMTFPAHLHHAAELVFVQDGSLTVTAQDQTKILRKNEAALIFPETIHSYLTQDFSRSVLCVSSPSRAK